MLRSLFVTLIALLLWIYFYSLNGLHDHLSHVPWKDIFTLGAPGASYEFCEYVKVKTGAYNPHQKY